MIKNKIAFFCLGLISLSAFSQNNEALEVKMKNNTELATVRELRRMLFDDDRLYSVIGEDEMDNTEARRFLFDKQDQEQIMSYFIDTKNCLHIW